MTSPTPSVLPLTGERTAPGVWHENYWFRRHEAAYRAVLGLCRGRRVLEAGCGEGYGAELLRTESGADVVAVDYDSLAVAHVRRRYPEVPVVRGNLVALPLRDRRADVVVSLQVVEHLWDQDAFVAECARVLRPGGRLVLSTPNRVTFSPPGSPQNPFHTRELDASELADLLGGRFADVRLVGLHHGARLQTWEAHHGPLADTLTRATPDTWPDEVARLVRDVGVEDFSWSPEHLATSLDLLAVATLVDEETSATASR